MAAAYDAPPEVKARLKDDVKKAQDLVERLTDPEKGRDTPHPDMPGSEIIRAAGLAWVFWKKVGLLALGLEGGYGFIIKKLGETADSTPVSPKFDWSAPLYFKMLGGAVGATLGYASVDSLVVLDTPEAVKAFAEPAFQVDADVGIGAGSDKLSAQAVGLPLTIPLSGDAGPTACLQWSISSGVYVDVSFKDVSIRRDDSWNEKLYGPEVKPNQVLDGKVPRPLEVFPLFDTLQGAVDRWLAAEAAAIAATFFPVPIIIREVVVVPGQEDKASAVEVRVQPEESGQQGHKSVEGGKEKAGGASGKQEAKQGTGGGKDGGTTTKASGGQSGGSQQQECKTPPPWGGCCADCKPCQPPCEMQPERDVYKTDDDEAASTSGIKAH